MAAHSGWSFGALCRRVRSIRMRMFAFKEPMPARRGKIRFQAPW